MTEQEQTLLDLFRKLSEQDAQSLLRFAEFMATSGAPVAVQTGSQQLDEATDDTTQQAEIPQPESIDRPEEERVVDALKRLSATYYMLDKKKLLDKASEQVAQHVMFGIPARQAIDQIEEIFKQAYDKFVEEAGS